jgi:DnaJ like chaperone protein
MPRKPTSKAAGARKGGAVRGALAAVWAGLGLDRLVERTPAHRTVAFTIAVTTLAAKMAKADGVALPVEARMFERIFEIPDAEQGNVRRLYDLAKQDVTGYEAYAKKIARLLKEEHELLRSVLECLFHISAADGLLHPEEDEFLRVVAKRFGIGQLEFLTIRASFVHDPHSPYEVLGVRPNATDAELKARHRALAVEHHPDRLAASGVPLEFRAAADRRLAAINAAYDEILRDRKRAEDRCTCEERCS